jgi:putative phosphoribosyl transferase
MPLPFRDRREAGRLLAHLLADHRGRKDVVVLALAPGGVPIGYEVALFLDAPLDVVVTRKLALPDREGLALGALSGGSLVLDHETLYQTGIEEQGIDAIAEREHQVLERLEESYREGRPSVETGGRTVLLIDDGSADRSAMLAAVRGTRSRSPARLIVAVPVAAPEVLDAIESEVDGVVRAETPHPFRAAGLWYEDFVPTSEEEVRSLLKAGQR